MVTIARIPAVLRGQDVASRCTLEAWRERSSTGHTFTRCRITEDAPELPDGPYEVIFDDHSVKTRKYAGAWELVYLPREITIDNAQWPRDLAG